MTEKYNDLTEEIWRADEGRTSLGSVNMVLDYLDRRPDQVPGRTITRSEYRDTLNGAVKVSGYFDDWERGFHTGLAVSGTKLVPDPEPTNAEKLAEAITNAAHGVGIGSTTANVKDIAEHLDAQGVKAPEADDD